MFAPDGNHTTMNTTKRKRLAGSRQGVYANISEATHARLLRRAPAAHLTAAKYTGIALEFYMDLEDGFGGPLTDQFKESVLSTVKGQAEKLKKALGK
jgi:hypothetical protein